MGVNYLLAGRMIYAIALMALGAICLGYIERANMQQRRPDGILSGSRFIRISKALAGLALGAAATSGAASAQSINVNVDSSLADYLLDAVCSDQAVDEAWLRSSPLVQAQIEHHTSLSSVRNIDALLGSLEAASRCEVPEDDVFRFRPIVEDKEKFEATVEFLKSRAPEIEAFVAESIMPYAPEGLEYSGKIVLSVVGNPCGGFASGKYFFLALNCLTTAHEGEYSAIKVVSAMRASMRSSRNSSIRSTMNSTMLQRWTTLSNISSSG